MDAVPRKRLDQHLVETGRYASRSRAADAIRRGCVMVDGRVETRTSAPVSTSDRIEIADEASGYVSRAALKLKAALDPHGICNPGKLGLPDPFGAVRWPPA